MNRLLVINLSAVRIETCSFKRDVLVTWGTPATQVGQDWFLGNCQGWRKVRLKRFFFFFFFFSFWRASVLQTFKLLPICKNAVVYVCWDWNILSSSYLVLLFVFLTAFLFSFFFCMSVIIVLSEALFKQTKDQQGTHFRKWPDFAKTKIKVGFLLTCWLTVTSTLATKLLSRY